MFISVNSMKKGFKNKYKLAILFVLFVALIFIVSSYAISSCKTKENKIALIKIYGPIAITQTDSFLLSSTSTTTSTVINNIKKAKADKSVKAVIFEINSPGGSVVASQELADAISSIDKPKVAYIREVGASGAYWAASATDKIVASPMAITGDIGVISSYLDFSKLFEKYGITYDRLVAGEYKDMGSPYKELTSQEKQLLQKKLDVIYEYFVNAVAKNRKMPVSEVKKLADGSFYLGTEAKENGLIDYVGDKELAVNITKQLAGLKDAKLISYKEETGILNYLTKLSSYYIGRGIGTSLVSIEPQLQIKT